MFKIDLTNIAITALISAAVVWAAKKLLPDNALNPASEDNIFYQAADRTYRDMTGSNQSLGADFYDYLHPEEQPEVIREQIIDDLAGQGIDYYGGIYKPKQPDISNPESELIYYQIDPVTGATIYQPGAMYDDISDLSEYFNIGEN